MIITRQITLEDKPFFDSFYRYPTCSLYNFTNIYMWSPFTRAALAVVDGMLCIFTRYRDYPPSMRCPLPETAADILRIPEVIREVRRCMPEISTISGVPAEVVKLLRDRFPLINSIDSRDQADYIYSADELRQLSGRRFHGKRNHLNAFIKSCDYVYTGITSDNTGILRNAVEALYTDTESRDLADEQEAIRRLLDSFEPLGLRACVISADGRPVAYSIGEMMDDSCALIHIEKADRSIPGSYAAVNNLFLNNAFPEASLVNREEDMGIEGLRRAKLSYNPIKLNNISTIKFTDQEEFFNVKGCNAEQMACSCRGVCK